MCIQKKYFFFIISGIILTTIASMYNIYAADVNITLEITGIGLRHGTPTNANLGTLSGSLSDQHISGQFIEPFWVEDLQGYITGYYTTIQCDGVYNQNGYKLTGVELKAGNPAPELIGGMIGPNVKISSILSNYTNITEPITYIYKETNINHLGTVNKYGDKPRLKILIPPAAPAGIYSGTIVFSFYMN